MFLSSGIKNILKGKSELISHHSRKVHFVLVLLLILFRGCSKDEVDPPNTMRDIDGNIYKTITISGQTWMAENLRVVHYSDGTQIPGISDNRDWEFDESGMCCDYKFIADKKRGKLYSWNAIEEKYRRRLAPEGWHIPTDKEWQFLIDAMGKSNTAGYRLKDTVSWPQLPDYFELPEKIGFDAVPGGSRDGNGNFAGIDMYAGYWTNSNDNYFNKKAVIIWTYTESISIFDYSRHDGFSVRCIKDNN
jgi:uncharacterized protein (TIGR02145 family)